MRADIPSNGLSPDDPQGSRPLRMPVVAIDGPAGTGKSTLARRLASYLGWCYIDSGAMYRALALWAAEFGIAWDDEAALARIGAQLTFEFCLHEGRLVVRVNGRDVTLLIRRSEIGEGASRIATHQRVREILVEKQRQLARDGGVVMDGRDVGTVVFPNAEVKFYLDGSPEARARRRWLELQQRGEQTSFAAVLESMSRRDREDQTREASPLRVPHDASYIDTTNLSIDAVFDLMVDRVKFSGVSFHSPDPRQELRCPKAI